MAQQPYNGPRRAINHTIATDFKMRLNAPAQNNSIVDNNNRPRLPWMMLSYKHNQPQLTVNTNVEGDKDYGKITAAMDTFTWYAVLAAVENAADNKLVDADGKPTNSVSFDCLGYIFPGGKRSEQPVVKNRVIVGINDDDAVYIAVVAQGRPNIQFVFGPSEWHAMNNQQGRPVSISFQSRTYAKGYVQLMRLVSMHLLTTGFMTPDDIAAEKEANKQNRGGGGGGYQKPNNGGGYQKSNNNGGGYQKPQNNYNNNSADDDGDTELPW